MVKSGLRAATLALLAVAAACSTGAIGEAESGNASSLAPTPTAPSSPPDAAPPVVDPNVPTFAVDIEPIVQAKCQMCHRDGGVAPFNLMTFEDVTAHGLGANEKVTKREMPPWGAFDTEDCKYNHALKDDLRLTDTQIGLFSSWVKGGMPMGDASKRPAPRTEFPATTIDGATQYQIGKPYTVEANAGDDIRCFPIDPGITEDTWVTATNVVPDQPSVVHHVIVYLDAKKTAPSKVDESGSYKCFGGPSLGDGSATSLLLAWAPGVPPVGFGQIEAGIKIPKGAGLVMQVHYHPTNKRVVDQSKFELKKMASGTKPGHVAQVILAGNAKDAAGSNTGGRVKLLPGPDDPGGVPAFMIPSNATAHVESMDITPPAVPIELRIGLAGAHMHWAGTNMKMTIERAVEATDQPKNECLISTPKYDFNWQRGYLYDEPYEKLPTIASGDKLKLTCTYNNSVSNKNVQKAMYEENASSPFDLHLGETTHDEMCLGALVVLRDYVAGFD